MAEGDLPWEHQAPDDVHARDKVLYAMSQQGWANESGGDSYGIVGYLARISISSDELDEVVSAFVHEIDKSELADTQQLVGHFLVQAIVQRIGVYTYEDELALKRDFKGLMELHKAAEANE